MRSLKIQNYNTDLITKFASTRQNIQTILESKDGCVIVNKIEGLNTNLSSPDPDIRAIAIHSVSRFLFNEEPYIKKPTPQNVVLVKFEETKGIYQCLEIHWRPLPQSMDWNVQIVIQLREPEHKIMQHIDLHEDLNDTDDRPPSGF